MSQVPVLALEKATNRSDASDGDPDGDSDNSDGDSNNPDDEGRPAQGSR